MPSGTEENTFKGGYMKKILAGIVSAVLCASFLFGCGPKQTTEKKEGVDYTFNGHEIGDAVYVKIMDAGLGGEWMEALATAYYEETGIVVEVSADPNLITSSETVMGAPNSEKDDIYFVAQGNSNWLDWTNKNKIASLDDVLSSEKYGTPANGRARDENITKLGKYGDSVYLLPYIYSNWGLIYNQGYLDKIDGYGEYVKGQWPTTMQGLIDLCVATKNANLTNPRTGKTVKPYSCGMTVYYMNYMFYTLWDELDSAGLTAYLDQNDKSAFNSTEFNSPEVKRVFEILFDLIGATSETESNMCAAAEDHLASQTNFVNGNCVFTFSGVWFETEMKKILNSVGMTDYHYGSYPVVNSESKNRLYMNMPGEFFFIPSDAENVWGAKDFLAFCMSEKGVAAAEKVLNMPLAFSTDEKIAFSSFGEEIRDVVEKSKKLYIYSTNDVYRTGALALFKQDTNPLLKMSKYTVKSKSEIQSKCIDPEVSKHVELWTDYMKHLG